jgi:hypothetical protein
MASTASRVATAVDSLVLDRRLKCRYALTRQDTGSTLATTTEEELGDQQ